MQIIQWFVEPEARVEQFDKLCEVQSDKAAAEVCSQARLVELEADEGTDNFQIRWSDKEATL